MTIGKLITAFLVDGTPTGTRILEIRNWTGQALVGYRSNIKEFLKRNELSRPSVYFLVGRDDNGSIDMYIGETDDFSTRVKGHYDKDFWNQCIVFSSKDEHFNKAHVKHLESVFHDEIGNAGRVNIVRGNEPRGVALSEADIATMIEYKENVYLVLGMLGLIDINKPLDVTNGDENDNVLLLTRGGCNASMRVVPDGFVVIAGSIINPYNPKYDGVVGRHSLKSMYERRKMLVNNGKIVSRDGSTVLTSDQAFNSPSAAASFVICAPANGRTEWKTIDGRSLKEIEEGSKNDE